MTYGPLLFWFYVFFTERSFFTEIYSNIVFVKNGDRLLVLRGKLYIREIYKLY